MQPSGPDEMADALIEQLVPSPSRLAPTDRDRLRAIAANLRVRGLPHAFIASSLRSTAEVLIDLREDEERGDNVFQRDQVRRFIEQNAVPDAPGPGRYALRRERKREQKDRLQVMALHLLREARQARRRHEVKKTRNMLLKVDQRELRRVLGGEGDDLCRQINIWLRTTAPMF